MPALVAEDPGRSDPVVWSAVHVAVDPEIGLPVRGGWVGYPLGLIAGRTTPNVI